jgi:hypothetical protein
MARWVYLHVACRLLCLLLGLTVLTLATFEVWSDGQGEMERLFWRLHWFYWDELNLERKLGYVQGRGEVAPVLFVVGLVLTIGAKRLGSLIADTLALFGSWFLGKGFRITVTSSHVIVHRWCWWDLKFERSGDSPKVRQASAEEYFSALAPKELEAKQFLTARITNPPAVVEIDHHLQRYKLLMTKREDVAEAIVARINAAMIETRPAGIFQALAR